MLGEREIERFYMDSPLTVPGQWNLARKHFRIATRQGRFVKLNKFENRLDIRDLRSIDRSLGSDESAPSAF